MSSFAETFGIPVVRGVFAAVAAGDRDGVLAALAQASSAPRAVDFLYYLAGSALWNVAGGQYPTFEARRQVVAELRAAESLWAGVFPIGDLELLVDALSGEQVDVSGISDDHLTLGFLAVSAHQLPRRTDVWPTWEAHFDYLAAEFTKAHAPQLG